MSDSEMTDADELSVSSGDTEVAAVVSEKAKEQHLNDMKGALLDERPPYCSGTIAVGPKDLILFYENGGHVGRINFANPSNSELEKLMQACDPATFGHGDENVYDESVRKAGKLDTDKFASKFNPFDIRVEGSEVVNILDAVKFGLLWGDEIRSELRNDDDLSLAKQIKAELYKLNVYGKDGFFKSHKDTPRATNMFGSLVIVLPTPHTGGELVFRHKSKEWTFDPASAISKATVPSIVYAAFFSDVEHEVLPVKEGYRVTLTYNLYYKKPIQERIPRIPTEATLPSNAELFRTALEKSLEDKEFLPKGGLLGFGLQHLYPVFKSTWASRGNLVHPHLKGFDALVLSVCREAGLKTRIYFFVEDAIVSENVPDHTLEDYFVDEILNNFDGKPVTEKYARGHRVHPITWVTKNTAFNHHLIDYAGEDTLGNEANIEHAYAELVLIANVGPAKERKTYTDENASSSDDERLEKKEKQEQDSDEFSASDY
ncbi:hypothetical protein ACEPAF_7163 [Sanghuangporus sanghuang]